MARRKLKLSQYKMIVDEVEDGMSSKSSIAKRNGISLTYLDDIVNGFRCSDITGITPSVDNRGGGPCRWQEEGGELVSDAGVRDIVGRYRRGERIPDIHKDYQQATISYVSDIATRRRRKNVIV